MLPRRNSLRTSPVQRPHKSGLQTGVLGYSQPTGIAVPGFPPDPGMSVDSNVLLEDGFDILLEDGSFMLLEG